MRDWNRNGNHLNGDSVTKSDLEREFETYCQMLDVETPAREYCFAKEIGRRWRFDFAWPNSDPPVAVEIEGGTWSKGRHVRGKGYAKDCTKYNAAVMLGWKVLRFTSDMLREDPVGCVEQVQELLAQS